MPNRTDSIFPDYYLPTFIRIEMLKYQDEMMKIDQAFFCREAIRMYKAGDFPVWIVSDLRRIEELEYFRREYEDRMVLIRMEASDTVRTKRGFNFTEGVDDRPTECALDHFNDWHFRIQNDGQDSDENLMQGIMKKIEELNTM